MQRLVHAILFCVLGTLMLHSNAQTGVLPVPNRVADPIDETKLVTLKGNVHPLAQAQFDRGAAPGSMPTGRVRLVLERSAAQQRALTQYLADLQNPSSPAYHKWLTPAQYGASYGVSDSDIHRILSWLQLHGFKIDKVPESHQVIAFSGTFDQIQSAFHTTIHTYVVNGETHFANAGDPQIPAALAPVIGGVGPLNDFRPKPMLVRGPGGRFDPSSDRIIPELTLTGDNTPYLFVDPADAAVIYDTPNSTLNSSYAGKTYDGTGVSIGIAGVSDLTTADVANYRIAFLGESAGSVNLPTVVVDGNDPGLTGAGTEALLDTEVSGGIAPKAKIYFYTSADSDISSGLINAIFRALDDNQVSILSISFGNCESALGTAGNQMLLDAMEQAAAQGITVTVSAGDNGTAGCDDFDTETQATLGFGVNGFASTPYSIAVGGTDFDVLSSSFATYVNSSSDGTPPYYGTALKYIPEKPWNDSTTVNTTYANDVANLNSHSESNIVAGSGGVSSVYPKPAFQSSLTPNNGFRDLPDVSLLAGNGMYQATWVVCSDNVTDGDTQQGYIDCLTTGGQFTSNTYFSGVGGTSASAPAFAGMLALVAQAHGSASDNYRLGQADNVVYQLAQSKYSTVFHDITAGNNSVPCTAGSPDCGSNQFLTGYNAGTGYDLASGLGSVDAAQMVNNWTDVSLASTSTSLKIDGSTAAYTGVHGQSLTFDVDLSPSTASGVAGIVDNADLTAGGTASGPQNNGQVAIPLTNGSGSVTYNGLPGGSYAVTARYSGDSSFASSTSAPISVSISAEPSTTTLSVNAYNPSTGKATSSSNVPYGYLVFADADITGTAEGSNTQGVATGTVQFLNGSSVLGSSAVSSGNQASWPPLNSSFLPLPAGSYNLIAQYSGDASYLPSSATTTFTISKASTTITADYAVTPVQYGTFEQIDAAVSATNCGAAPTGTFQFYVDGKAILSPQPIYESFDCVSNSTGTSSAWADATTSYGFVPVGQHTLSASYSGDSNYAGGTSPAVSVTVSKANPDIEGYGFISPQGSPVVAGQSATGNASIGGAQYGVAPTGTVTFYDNNVALTDTVTYSIEPNAPTLNATIQHVFATPGTHAITVGYSGDSNYLSATTPVPQQLNVVGPITVGPAAGMVLSAPGQSGSESISVTPNGGFTGTVTLSCTPSGTETTCSFGSGSNITSTVQVTVTSSGAAATFNVTTTAPHQVAMGTGWRTSGFVLAALFLVVAPMKRRRYSTRLIALAIVLILSQTSCGSGSAGSGGGGGSTDQGTLPGTYSFTVTASTGTGANAYTTSTPVSVLVQ